ncbi:MAG: neutral zinc metallopeptidase [Chitinophagales bacterium]|nr:neutral zinc metallopeptidase [Bacteroidota bacterium]MCB9043326.1 neutral zinc metallopeptidase [Chitinophagales bacterium]
MRWQGRQGSSNVDDRRKGTAGKVVGGIGIGGIIIVIIGLLLGQNPLEVLNMVQSNQPAQSAPGNTQQTQANDEMGQFVSVVLKETENVWNDVFIKQLGRKYQDPTLVLFTQSDRSACGYASAATGPFYCPADQQVYIDLSFYQLLRDRFKAPGDFAMAYVIAHEVGHHVQNLLGITGQVDAQRRRLSEAQYNELSVRLELQADFLAGVWAHYMQNENILEAGDIEEAMRAAQAIGDDKLQMESQGYVVPDSFTHGTSEQRMRWFNKGFKTGDISQGDTFSASAL